MYPLSVSNVLLTGGTGCIGQEVGRVVQRAWYDARVLVHESLRWTFAEQGGMEADERQRDRENVGDAQRLQEAAVLLSYAMPLHNWHPTQQDIDRYHAALLAHRIPFPDSIPPAFLQSTIALRCLDMASKWHCPSCTLQQKLITASAIVECQPASAGALLPQERSALALFLQLVSLGLRSAGTVLLALPLLLRPSTLKRYAGAR